MKLKGSTAVITGGASGLGRAFAERVVAEGGNVAVLDLNKEVGEEFAASNPSRIAYFQVDVTSEESVKAALTAAVAKFGGIHIVLNSAGISSPCRVLNNKGAVHSMEHFDKVIRINLHGTFNVIRLALPIIAKQELVDGERGVIVNVASVAAFEGQVGQAAYAAAKGAVAAMTLPLARELAQFGVRVNTIAPGLFLTPMMHTLSVKVQESLSAQVPFPKRLGAPSEFADAVAHTVTNGYVNGTVSRLDGSIRMAAL